MSNTQTLGEAKLGDRVRLAGDSYTVWTVVATNHTRGDPYHLLGVRGPYGDGSGMGLKKYFHHAMDAMDMYEYARAHYEHHDRPCEILTNDKQEEKTMAATGPEYYGVTSDITDEQYERLKKLAGQTWPYSIRREDSVNDLLAALATKTTSARVLDALSYSGARWVRWGVAENKHTSQDSLMRLTRVEDVDVRKLASRALTEQVLLGELLKPEPKQELTERPGLVARFTKATPRERGKSHWSLWEDDVPIFLQTVDQLTGGQSEVLHDCVATEEFGKGLLVAAREGKLGLLSKSRTNDALERLNEDKQHAAMPPPDTDSPAEQQSTPFPSWAMIAAGLGAGVISAAFTSSTTSVRVAESEGFIETATEALQATV